MILVTGSSPSEGKTTTAVNLATSLALAGNRVILIESDLRRPVLSKVMDAQPEHGGVVSVLIENTTLAESLIPSPTYGPNLRLLALRLRGRLDRRAVLDPDRRADDPGRPPHGRLRDHRLGAAERGGRRAAARPPGRRGPDRRTARASPASTSFPSSPSCWPRTASARSASRWSAPRGPSAASTTTTPSPTAAPRTASDSC